MVAPKEKVSYSVSGIPKFKPKPYDAVSYVPVPSSFVFTSLL